MSHFGESTRRTAFGRAVDAVWELLVWLVRMAATILLIVIVWLVCSVVLSLTGIPIPVSALLIAGAFIAWLLFEKYA